MSSPKENQQSLVLGLRRGGVRQGQTLYLFLLLCSLPVIQPQQAKAVPAQGSGFFPVSGDEFSAVSNPFPSQLPESVDWGDFDNDGDLDLIAIGVDSGTRLPKTVLWRNDGGGKFTEITNGLPQLWDGVVVWGDYNGDGFLDLLFAGGTQSFILKGHGDGTFTDIGAPLPPTGSRLYACWVDVDNDGDLDAYLESGLFRNDGHDHFTRVPLPFDGSPSVGIAWGDYDNDGDQDVVISRNYGFDQFNGGYRTRLYRNDGNFQLTDLGGGFPHSFAILTSADINNDGFLDVLVGASSGEHVALVFTNTQRYTFSKFATNGLPATPQGMGVMGDYDNDGLVDLLLAGSRWNSDPATPPQVYHNNGDGTFTSLQLPLSDHGIGNSVWGDYDNDGRLDFLIAGARFGAQLFHNNTPVRNVPPAAPSGLHSVIAPNSEVLLTWVPGIDPVGPSSPRYNLRVGTRPGAEDVMPASSDPITGWHRLANYGNAGSTNFWRLRLPAGTYYWTVQAIDAGMAASPFAPEAAFTIEPPVISQIATLENGTRKLTFSGPAGSAYAVAATSSLQPGGWQVLGPAREASPGSYEYIDFAPAPTKRFYRVQSQ